MKYKRSRARIEIQRKLALLKNKLVNQKIGTTKIKKSKVEKNPLINILTRTSNREKAFGINLKSIHNQNYYNIRHLVTVDNDESEIYVKKYQKIYNFEYIRVSEIDYKDIEDIDNPNTGKCFIWNHYFNTLLDKVERGFIMYLDDDDRFIDNTVISQISKKINSEDDMIFWQMKFKSGWVVPPDNQVNKPPAFCRIGTPCVCYHSKHKNIKWDGWKCGDFRLINQVYKQTLNHKWIHKILVLLGNDGGGGNKVDLTNDLVNEINNFDQHFDILVTGWNCEKYVGECLDSILSQVKGQYTYKIHIVNDGSTDKTKSKLDKYKKRWPHLINVIHNQNNKGAAFARWQILQQIKDNDSIVVLLDLDDYLPLNVLKKLTNEYNSNSNLQMTLGSFISTTNKKYTNGVYSNKMIDNQNYHDSKIFKAPSLRTFNSKLIHLLSEDMFKDGGKWMMYCTDVPLVIGVLKQLKSENVKFFDEVMYVYRKNRKSNTLTRFSSRKKKELYKKIVSRFSQLKFEDEKFNHIPNSVAVKSTFNRKNHRILGITGSRRK